MTRCDFCNTPNPTIAYDAGSEIRLRAFVEGAPQVLPDQMFSRFWAACDVCASYIDSDNIDGLKEAVLVLHRGEWESDFEFIRDNKEWIEFHNAAMTALYNELKAHTLTRVKG